MAQNSAMIALTDMEWLTILEDKEIYSNVNFWTPTPWNIKNLQIGGTVFFLSKIEYGRKICGFGIFREYKNLNIHLAWEEFGYANGVSSFDELERRINKYVSLNSHSGFKFDEHEIGCIVLDNIVFFDKEDRYSPNHYGWEIGKQVVKYKYVEPICYPNIARSVLGEDFQLVNKKPQYKYVPQKKRKNQSAFKNMLINIYGEQCCITGESVSAVLDAAHIQEDSA